MKQRCLSLVLAISMIMVSASPFSYAKDTLGGVSQNTRTTTIDETEEILPIKATDSEASDIQKYPLDDKEHIASASNPALFATKKTKQKADLPDGIYLSQSDGNDGNTGLDRENAVKTFEQAKSLMEENSFEHVYLCGNYVIDGTEEWDLDGKTLNRYGFISYMIDLKGENSNLTLSNIVIDAENTIKNPDESETGDSIIQAFHGGSLTLNDGAILENNNAQMMGTAVFGINGFNMTMNDGAVIQNNTNHNAHYGGAVTIANNSTFTMNGGLITGNTANRGGGVAVIGSSMVMNGGSIEKNKTYTIGSQFGYGGGIYLADWQDMSGVGENHNQLLTSLPASFVMNGGEISENVAQTYGGGLVTFPQSGNNSPEVSVEINNGIIADNEVTDGSGGALAMFFNSTKFRMNGGKLIGNKVSDFGGGIFMYSMKGTGEISDGLLSENEAAFGGGIMVQDNTELFIKGGTISQNQASGTGGGYYIWRGSQLRQTGGSCQKNKAENAGGVYISPNCTFTMTGGDVSGNNPGDQKNTTGDGIYVNGFFEMGDSAQVTSDNDVYLPKDHYIKMISEYTGTTSEAPIMITSEEDHVENLSAIGTKLVLYTNEAGGAEAAKTADLDRIFVPSKKMRSGLAIGESQHETDWMTYISGIRIHYEWVGTCTPSDAKPPVDDAVRVNSAYTAKSQEESEEGYKFDGWYLDQELTQKYVDGTTLSTDTVLYGEWKEDPDSAYAITITPMDITVYVGGNGYKGVIGSDNQFASNDLPEMGYYLTLPANISQALQDEGAGSDVSDHIELTYDDGNGTTIVWNLKLYGDEEHSSSTLNGTEHRIYRILPGKVNGTDETIPVGLKFMASDGSVIVSSDFPVKENDTFRDYKVDIYSVNLNASLIRAKIKVGNKTLTRTVRAGTGNLKVRGNVEEKFSDVTYGGPKLERDASERILASAAQPDTMYFINKGNVKVTDPSGVRLLVDQSLGDGSLAEYLDKNVNTDGRFSYIFKYLDLVDTHNGDAYVTMAEGQKMNVYWPVPKDASRDSEFRIIHFETLHRESNVDTGEQLRQNPPTEISCEKIVIDGKEFITFTTHSFSPFALLYEKGGSGSTDQPVDPKPDPSNPTTPVKSPSNANRSDSSDDSDDSGSSTTTRKNQTVTTNTTTSTNTTETDQTAGGTDETNLPGTTGENNESTSETVETDETKLPQTGQTWWPVWLLMMAGGALIFVGWLIKKREK